MKRLIIAVAIPYLLITEAGTQAQSTVPNPTSTPTVEDRVGKLENNVGEILDLLKKQQAQQAASSGTSTPTAAPASNTQNHTPIQQPAQKLKKGPILELWTLKNDTGDTFPTGRSLGGVPDLGDSFSLGNINKIAEFKSLSTTQLAFQWSGKVNIKEKGTYVFLAQGNKTAKPITSDDHEYIRGNWYIGLDIENDNVISEKSPEIRCYDNLPMTFPLSAQVDLQPGVYTIKLKTFIISKSENPVWNYEPLSISLKMRGPSDNIPVEIGNMNGNMNHLESN